MPFSFDYIVPTTGATATYHEVTQINLDKASTSTVATVASYVNADTRTAGKLPLYTQQIQVAGLPDSSDPFAWAESELVEQAPVPVPDGTVFNRYTFAGGTQTGNVS